MCRGIKLRRRGDWYVGFVGVLWRKHGSNIGENLCKEKSKIDYNSFGWIYGGINFKRWKKSGRGILAQYADPVLREKEQYTWEWL